MSTPLARFLRTVESRFGLRFSASQHPHVERVMNDLAARARLPIARWLDRLAGQADQAEEIAELVARLTVNESYFFRHRSQLDALVELAVPARRAARGPDAPVRILSAGAAGGEELHSIAILLAEQVPHAPFELTGLDLNPANVARARAGRYSAWSLRDTPAETRGRWFRQVGGEYVLDPAIRKGVRFERKNLIEPDPAFWRPDAFDIIVCRNVTIYFDMETTRRLLDRFASALVPGGFLFLGHSETARGLTDAFELQQGNGAFYYVRSGGGALPQAPGRWIDEIAEAYQRITSLGAGRAPVAPLAEAPVPSPAPASPALAAPVLAAVGSPLPAQRDAPWGAAVADRAPSVDLAPLQAMLAAERFDDVIAKVAEMPPAAAQRTEVQVALAIAATNRGRFDEAAAACAKVLAQDPRSAGAHYLLALGAEHRGEIDRAAWHDAAALETDPSFGLARLHLALLARRRGDSAVARREFEAAHALLERDDPRRLRLYGGGFAQEALLRMCRMHAPRRTR